MKEGLDWKVDQRGVYPEVSLLSREIVHCLRLTESQSSRAWRKASNFNYRLIIKHFVSIA